MFKGKKAKGFTLVEILVVILIIGLLFVYLVPKISSATDKARETGIKTDMHSYQVAFESVVKENSGLGTGAVTGTLKDAVNNYLDPALQVSATAATVTPAAVTGHGIVNLKTAKKDPWNKEYELYAIQETGKNNGAVAIVCGGKDATVDSITLAAPSATGTLGQTFNVAGTDDGHDYALITSYVDGQQYTVTAGFSKNIAE